MFTMLAALLGAVEDLDGQLGGVLESADLALVLEGLRLLRADINLVAASVEQRLHATMPDRRLGTPFGVEEKSNPTDRKNWDPTLATKGLTKVLVLSSPASNEAAMARMADVIVARLPASFDWRVTGLRELGFVVDEWCEESKTRKVVTFKGSADTARRALMEAARSENTVPDESPVVEERTDHSTRLPSDPF